jgi:hypothetical protein
MQNKPNAKNWDEIKVVITAIAFTLTLAFWNLFSGQAAQKVTQKPTPLAPVATATVQPFQGNVKILLGGAAPKTQVIVSQGPSRSAQSQAQAPQPAASTSSSK